MGAARNEKENTPGPREPEVQQLEEALRREHEMYLRALADFENYRKRVDAERSAGAREGSRRMVLSLLDLMDDFERALQVLAQAPPTVFEGIQAIQRKLLAQLEAEGVRPFDSLGETFRPELHEAIGGEEVEGQEPGTIINEIRRGYRWGDKVLRPALVRVAQ